MDDLNNIRRRNEELAQQVNDEARSNPQSAYAGKFVGLANGQVVAIADTLDEVVDRLQAVEPDPQRTFCIEASLDYNTVQFIGGAF